MICLLVFLFSRDTVKLHRSILKKFELCILVHVREIDINVLDLNENTLYWKAIRFDLRVLPSMKLKYITNQHT